MTLPADTHPVGGGQIAIVVGGGHAAGELAINLREQGWQGRIVMIGEEPSLPYQRPPLSKAFLDGSATEESLYLRPAASYAKAQVETELSVRVENIDRNNKTVKLSDGRTLHYDKLALATGGRKRPLPGDLGLHAAATNNFHYLRTLADTQGIRGQIKAGARMAIIGGGYIGLEVAATATKHGMHVTVLEAAPRVLARVTSPELSAFFESAHRQAGVDLRCSTAVENFEFDAAGKTIVAVRCADGSRIETDMVVAGIGLLPNVEIAEAAGLAVSNGIVVDEFCRTSDSDIVAAGDCTNHPNDILGKRLRLESVPNAVEQARTAAATLCGKSRPYRMVPWFWSDQYDLKLKSVGLCEDYDRLVLRGSTEKRAFAMFYLKGDHVVAVDTVNRPQEFMVSKRLIAEKIAVDAATLADEAVPMKNLLPPT